MPKDEFIELKQEDVFSYIDQDLKKERQNKPAEFSQKTRNNFTVILAVNLIALLIASTGFIIVYQIFKAGEYKLVGAEGSIKGLEDVLYKELQKKASIDLELKQKELALANSKLDELNKKMSKMQAEQQRVISEKYKKLQKELSDKLQADLKNAAADEKEKIRAKYESEVAASKVQQEAEKEKTQIELQKKFEADKKTLIALTESRSTELKATETALVKANQEFTNKLAEMQYSNQKAISMLNAQLEDRLGKDSFQNQVNSLFLSAFDAYQKNQLNSMRDKLDIIEKLYQGPQAENVFQEKKTVDLLVVKTLRELSIPVKKAAPEEVKKISDLRTGLESLRKFGQELQSGVYRNKPDQLQTMLDQFNTSMPEVFLFYQDFQNYQKYYDDIRAANDLSTAAASLKSGDYRNAFKTYVSVLKKYPVVNNRDEVLGKIEEVYFMALSSGSAVQTTNLQVDTDVKAEALFVAGNAAVTSRSLDEAIAKFQSLLLNYPASRFTKPALESLQQVYETKYTTLYLDSIKKEQNAKAAVLYREASTQEKLKNYDSAKVRYADIIIKFPQSEYLDKSVTGIERSITAKLRAGTLTVQTDHFLKESVGRVVDDLGDEVVLYLEGMDGIALRSKVYLYRKENDTEFRYIGEAEISDISPVMVKANILNKRESVRIGDLVYTRGSKK